MSNVSYRMDFATAPDCCADTGERVLDGSSPVLVAKVFRPRPFAAAVSSPPAPHDITGPGQRDCDRDRELVSD